VNIQVEMNQNDDGNSAGSVLTKVARWAGGMNPIERIGGIPAAVLASAIRAPLRLAVRSRRTVST
jgi:hypothetical protein